MYPLTQNQPKALLPLGGKLIIDYIVEQITMLSEVNEIIVVSNQKYVTLFEEWSEYLECNIPITILNDGSITEEDCIGDMGDIYAAIYSKKIKEDVLIASGESCTFSPLLEAYQLFMENQCDTVCIQKPNSQSLMPDRLLPILDNENKVLYIEKINNISKSDAILSDICFVKADTLPLVDRYLYEGNDNYIYDDESSIYRLDSFLQWLSQERTLYAFNFDEKNCEINTIDEYEILRDKLGKSIGDTNSIIRENFNVFLVFVKVGALTFGAGYNMLPLLYKELAVKRKWVTVEEITDYFVISQCVPGLTVIKTSALLGYRYKKNSGALAAGLGVAFPVLGVSLLIAIFFDQLIEIEWVRHIFNGLQVAVLALVIEAVIQMWKTGIKKDVFCIIIFVVSVLSFSVFNISPILAVVIGGLSGLIIRQFAKEKKVVV